MTPAEFRKALKRQGLTQYELGKLVYAGKNRGAIEQRVSRWANGRNKVPGGVQAFLELREYHEIGLSPEMRDGLELLRYCKDLDLSLMRAKNAIREQIRYRKLGGWQASKLFRLTRRAKKWGLID